MNVTPVAELINALAAFLTPTLAAWAIWYGATKAAETYRWQKALDRRSWWYRRVLHDRAELKIATVRVGEAPTQDYAVALEKKKRAENRFVNSSSLSYLYAGPAAHTAVWSLRFRFEEIEEQASRIVPDYRLELEAAVIQGAFNEVAREGRSLIGIPHLPAPPTPPSTAKISSSD